MAEYTKEIKDYKMHITSGSKSVTIFLYHTNTQTPYFSWAGFRKDDSNPDINVEGDSKIVSMEFPRWYIPIVIDMLRNEKPIYAYWRINDFTHKVEYGQLGTSKEPVGEEEAKDTITESPPAPEIEEPPPPPEIELPPPPPPPPVIE